MITLDTYLADDTCIEYEFAVASFSPGRPSRSGHPLDPSGEDGEVELAEDVTVYVEGGETVTFGLDAAIAAVAASRDWSLAKAREEIESLAWQEACEQAANEDRWDGGSWLEEERAW